MKKRQSLLVPNKNRNFEVNKQIPVEKTEKMSLSAQEYKNVKADRERELNDKTIRNAVTNHVNKHRLLEIKANIIKEQARKIVQINEDSDDGFTSSFTDSFEQEGSQSNFKNMNQLINPLKLNFGALEQDEITIS